MDRCCDACGTPGPITFLGEAAGLILATVCRMVNCGIAVADRGGEGFGDAGRSLMRSLSRGTFCADATCQGELALADAGLLPGWAIGPDTPDCCCNIIFLRSFCDILAVKELAEEGSDVAIARLAAMPNDRLDTRPEEEA